jgi:hypothetical protein
MPTSVCACKDHKDDFEQNDIFSDCDNKVSYCGTFKKDRPYRLALRRPCDPDENCKAFNASVSATRKSAVEELNKTAVIDPERTLRLYYFFLLG